MNSNLMNPVQYGICIEEIKIIQIPEFMEKSEILQPGCFVKCVNFKDGQHVIQNFIYNKTTVKWGNDIFLCKMHAILRLTEEEFNILLAVNSRVLRFEILKERNLLNFIKKLSLLQIVRIRNPGLIKNDSPEKLQCFINYIGKVPEIGIGTFFGFLLENDSEKIYHRGTLAPKYLMCDNTKGFISSAEIFLQFKPNLHMRHNERKDKVNDNVNLINLNSDNENNKRNQRNNNRRERGRGPRMPNNKLNDRYASNESLISQISDTSTISTKSGRSNRSRRGRNNNKFKSSIEFEKVLPKTNIKPLIENEPVKSTNNAPSGNITQQIKSLEEQIQMLKNQLQNKDKKTNNIIPFEKVEFKQQYKAVDKKRMDPMKICKLNSCQTQKRFRDKNFLWSGLTLTFVNKNLDNTCSCYRGLKVKDCISDYQNTIITKYKESLVVKCFTINDEINIKAGFDLPALIDLNVKNPKIITYKPFANEKELLAKANEFSLVRNKTEDKCLVCKNILKRGMGICIRECLHVYCNSCLLTMIENGSSLKIQCKFNKCPYELKEEEIKFLAPKDLYEKLQKITEEIERRSKLKTFICKVEGCKGFWSIEKEKINDLKISPCTKCNTLLCLICDANHIGYSCIDYKKYKKLDYSNAKDNWICMTCTFFNQNMTSICECCGSKKLIYDYNLLYENDHDNEDEDDDIHDEVLKYSEFDDINLIRNSEEFECKICYCPIEPGQGVILHECLHEFCDDCLIGQISNSLGAVVKCPYADDDTSCEKQLQDREIRALVSDELFEKYLQRSLRIYQSQLNDGFQCKTPDCIGFWTYDEYIISHICEVCNQKNCLHCYAIHAPLSCKEYQQKLFNENDPALIQTKKMFEDMINVGKAMKCPSCKIIISRDEGCSWVKCSVCNLEICWATKGPRWGPKGEGDTSGGCGCDFVNKRPCHPSCAYCH